jgi:hypothetical protein
VLAVKVSTGYEFRTKGVEECLKLDLFEVMAGRAVYLRDIKGSDVILMDEACI